MADENTLAKELVDSLAGPILADKIARLYSQHTLLMNRQQGLVSWNNQESQERLHDAVRLLEAGLIQRDIQEPNWAVPIRRAGEIFEWLSHPSIADERVPTELLAAACYQLSGYPARASGVMKSAQSEDLSDSILVALLQHDFASVHSVLHQYWSSRGPKKPRTELDFEVDESLAEEKLFDWLQEQLFSIIGIINARMRWGSSRRLGPALEKLDALCRVLLHGPHLYSWLLSELVKLSISENLDNSLRSAIREFQTTVTEAGQKALEKYLRLQYMSGRVTAWPSQKLGINKLIESRSFALCTPTGSGKTLVAELAILQSLFRSNQPAEGEQEENPLVLYLVPSRALATEVEGKLSRVLKRLGDEEITVTGLYGGADWGPTDAWLTAGNKTVVICTYEKAEALIRFVGRWFLSRLRLVVIDEAHFVCFTGSSDEFANASTLHINRSLRLESLGARLLYSVDKDACDVIALSAVAQGAEPLIAKWISSDSEVDAATTTYRSTRQLIGRIECYATRKTKIEYDLLDGAPLKLSNEQDASVPYIREPFPKCPPAKSFEKEGPEKVLRPFLFWASIQLSKPSETGQRQSVLISVTQDVYAYAKDFLQVLQKDWGDADIPEFFDPPTEGHAGALYDEVLESCKDYFGADSYEHRLLKLGIVVHHGQMPGLLARLLIEAIDARVFSIVLATSTLSEGVNLPFETVLVPTLLRAGKPLNSSEFKNLAGRAGRPGTSTEGRTLVFLGSNALLEKGDTRMNSGRRRYTEIVAELNRQSASRATQGPLAVLMAFLAERWMEVSKSNSIDQFFDWLETVNPLSVTVDQDSALLNGIDTLDAVLIAAVSELEQIAAADLNPTELETSLKELWQHTFSSFVHAEIAQLEQIFVRRGRALPQIYNDRKVRRQLYRTGLPPRAGSALIDIVQELATHFQTGENYAEQDSSERLEFIRMTIEQLSRCEPFAMPELTEGKRKPPFRQWDEVLAWWMQELDPTKAPKPEKLDDWHKYVRTNFINRVNWGVGAVIALFADETLGERDQPLDIGEWKKLGLPWVVFWFKELMTWGTSDPMVAYLLSKNLATTRNEAKELAAEYYAEMAGAELLDPGVIAEWAETLRDPIQIDSAAPADITVILERDFSEYEGKPIRVIPVQREGAIEWIDAAGYLLAKSSTLKWKRAYVDRFDFRLIPAKRLINAKPFI